MPPETSLQCTPMAVARDLGMKPYDWQYNVMRDVMPMWSNTALLAANESGKTSIIIVAVVMWHLMMFTNGTVVLTSGAFRQVEGQVFANLKKREDRFPGWVFNSTEILAPYGNRAVGFSTDDAGKFEGWHAEDHETGPLLIITDESKSVGDNIDTAISRCRPTRKLSMSSPGAAEGWFYRAHTTERAGWKHHKVTAYDCPHISREKIAQDIAKYGEDNPLIRSMIFAEWMLGSDTQQFVFPDQKFEAAKNRKAYHQPGDREAFCDFAVSPAGDENVLALRDGNKVVIADAWLGSGDIIPEAYRFISLFKKHRLTPREIAGDVSGIGQGYCDAMANMGWEIERVNNGAAASQPTRYANLGTENYFEACTKAERGELIFPWEDERFRKQLTTRKYEPTLKGQLQLLSKKKQGGESPDRADGVVGCCRKYGGRFETHDMYAKASGVYPSLNELAHGAGADDEDDGPSWMRSTI